MSSLSSLIAFISLGALQPDHLAELILSSVSYLQTKKEEDIDTDNGYESIAKARAICESTLKVINTIEYSSNQGEGKANKPHTRTKSNRSSFMSSLSPDTILNMCDYLDSFDKARLRFTSMSMHIDMLGCPLDLSEIISSVSLKTPLKVHRDSHARTLIPLITSCAPMRVIKRSNACSNSCDASRQLQLIDLGTAEVNPKKCENMSLSQLFLLGIGRSWSIRRIKVDAQESCANIMKMHALLDKHSAYRSVKQLEYIASDENKEAINTFHQCTMAAHIEDIRINYSLVKYTTRKVSSLDILLPSFRMLRHVSIGDVNIDGNLDSFVVYLPQVEKLFLYSTNITGDISCLAALKSLTKLAIIEKEDDSKIHGDVASLSSLVKLEHFTLEYTNVVGNIAFLRSLINLESIYLEGTQIEGYIQSLLKHSKLNYLYMSKNSKIKGDLNLNGSIEILNVTDNEMHLNLSSLTKLTCMKECYIYNMPHVEGDISMLSHLTNLNFIEMVNCPQIYGNINSLATLPNLESVIVDDLPGITCDYDSFMRLCGGRIGTSFGKCEKNIRNAVTNGYQPISSP